MIDEKKTSPTASASAAPASAEQKADELVERDDGTVLIEMTQGPRKGRVVALGRPTAEAVLAARRGRRATVAAAERHAKRK